MELDGEGLHKPRDKTSTRSIDPWKSDMRSKQKRKLDRRALKSAIEIEIKISQSYYDISQYGLGGNIYLLNHKTVSV
jgi:hypothetical protein